MIDMNAAPPRRHMGCGRSVQDRTADYVAVKAISLKKVAPQRSTSVFKPCRAFGLNSLSMGGVTFASLADLSEPKAQAAGIEESRIWREVQAGTSAGKV